MNDEEYQKSLKALEDAIRSKVLPLLQGVRETWIAEVEPLIKAHNEIVTAIPKLPEMSRWDFAYKYMMYHEDNNGPNLETAYEFDNLEEIDKYPLDALTQWGP